MELIHSFRPENTGGQASGERRPAFGGVHPGAFQCRVDGTAGSGNYPQLTKESLRAVFAYVQECMEDEVIVAAIRMDELDTGTFIEEMLVKSEADFGAGRFYKSEEVIQSLKQQIKKRRK